MGLGEAEMGGAGEIAGAAAEDALLFAMEEMGSFIPMGMQYQPTVESAEDVLKKQAELQFYEVGVAISDTYNYKTVWIWKKGYQTEWEQGYWYRGQSVITQWLSYSQARTYLEVTVKYWDPDEEKIVERPYRNQNPQQNPARHNIYPSR